MILGVTHNIEQIKSLGRAKQQQNSSDQNKTKKNKKELYNHPIPKSLENNLIFSDFLNDIKVGNHTNLWGKIIPESLCFLILKMTFFYWWEYIHPVGLNWKNPVCNFSLPANTD